MIKATLALSALAALAAAQEPGPAPAPPKRAPAWPKLERAQQDRIQDAIKTLRSTKKEERRSGAIQELEGLGAGAAPFLLRRLSDYRVNVNGELAQVLDAATKPEHAALLARHATDKKVAVRLYVLRRLTSFRLPDMAAVFRAALGDANREIAFQAALGLTSAGDTGGLEAVFAASMERWPEVAEQVAGALPGARGVAATQWVAAKMAKGGEHSVVTGLRLLRWLCEKDGATLIAPYLDSHSNNVKKAAINALRVIVDGKKPLEKLSVFQAIEMARTWKARI